MVRGIFLISKPKGITSHDVIDYLRRVTGERTIGHAGTLDPAASGLLIVAVGREFTKKISQYVGLNKEYEAEIILGKTSTTYDSEGTISDYHTFVRPRESVIRKVLQEFLGKQEQMPPIYSAKKIKGRKAYELARAGKQVDLKPVKIQMYDIELLDYKYPLLEIKTMVSSGTYIRSLAHDIGQKLGTGAYLSALLRTKIGDYTLKSAAPLSEIKNVANLEKYRIKC